MNNENQKQNGLDIFNDPNLTSGTEPVVKTATEVAPEVNVTTPTPEVVPTIETNFEDGTTEESSGGNSVGMQTVENAPALEQENVETPVVENTTVSSPDLDAFAMPSEIVDPTAPISSGIEEVAPITSENKVPTDINDNVISVDQAMPSTWNMDAVQMDIPHEEVSTVESVATETPAAPVENAGVSVEPTPAPTMESTPNVVESQPNNGATPAPMPAKPKNAPTLKSRTNNTVGIIIGLIVVIALGIGVYFALNALGIVGGNKLVCTIEEDGAKGKLELQFKDNEVSNLTMNAGIELPKDATEEEKNTFVFTVSMMDSIFAMAGEQDGVEYDSTKDENKYDYTLSVDMTKEANESFLENFDIDVEKGQTKEEMKKALTEEGYKCK